jgi:hypothetical protein
MEAPETESWTQYLKLTRSHRSLHHSSIVLFRESNAILSWQPTQNNLMFRWSHNHSAFQLQTLGFLSSLKYAHNLFPSFPAATGIHGSCVVGSHTHPHTARTRIGDPVVAWTHCGRYIFGVSDCECCIDYFLNSV